MTESLTSTCLKVSDAADLNWPYSWVTERKLHRSFSGLLGRENGSPAVADFNGDGNLDLAIPITGPKGHPYLQIYLGKEMEP